MFITRKKYEQNIREAVKNAIAEADRERRIWDRIEHMDYDVDRRFDRYNERLAKIEKKVFPERYTKTDSSNSESAINLTSC